MKQVLRKEQCNVTEYNLLQQIKSFQSNDSLRLGNHFYQNLNGYFHFELKFAENQSIYI